jgi:two-component system, NarL family, nitrate/nitrite response regulator NarL
MSRKSANRKASPMQHPTIRIVVADGQPMIRAGLRLSLEGQGKFQIVAEAENGQEALLASSASRPDVLVLDANLKRIASLELIGRLLETQSQLRIIVMFPLNETADMPAFLEAGAHGFVSKAASPIEFINAVQAAMGGGTYFSQSLVQLAFQKRQAAAEPISSFGLTGREVEVLRFICGGFSNKDIARRLDLSVRTVETHRLNIRKKTRAERLRDLVSIARQLGLDGAALETSPAIFERAS